MTETYVTDPDLLKTMFFAHQTSSNACATHALLSVLLNVKHASLCLGPTLTQLVDDSRDMTPEEKGDFIGKNESIAAIHNSFAVPESSSTKAGESSDSVGSVRTKETFHFVSFVRAAGRLVELDGLKSCPVDHGPVPEGTGWTERFKEVITERLGSGREDIMFSLMAVIPDRRVVYSQALERLTLTHTLLAEEIEKLKQVHKVSVRQETPSVPSTPPALPTASVGSTNRMSILKVRPAHSSLSSSTLNAASSPVLNTSALFLSEEEQAAAHLIWTFHNYCKTPGPVVPGSSGSESPAGGSRKTSAVEARQQKKKAVEAQSVSVTITEMDIEDDAISIVAEQDEDEREAEARRRLEEDFSSLNVHYEVSKDGVRLDSAAVSQEEFDGSVTLKVQPASTKKPFHYSAGDVLRAATKVREKIKIYEANLRDEHDIHKKYQIDNSRRNHSYDLLITTWIKMMYVQGHLPGVAAPQKITHKAATGPASSAARRRKAAADRKAYRPGGDRKVYRKKKVKVAPKKVSG